MKTMKTLPSTNNIHFVNMAKSFRLNVEVSNDFPGKYSFN